MKTTRAGLQHFPVTLLLATAGSMALAADSTTLLQQRLEPIEGWRAHFEQEVRDEQGRTLQQASGTLAVLRPNHLRWESEEPFRYLVVSDGDVLWRYDPDLEQANREPFRGELADTPGLILSGDPAAIASRYHVEHRQVGDELHFILRPLSDDAPFSSLELHWRGSELLRLTMHDSLDQQTRVQFHDTRVDVDLEPGDFSFSPPPGTDVIDTRGDG